MAHRSVQSLFRLDVKAPEQVGRSIRTHRWKYSVYAPDKDGYKDSGSDHYEEQFLYNLESDPHELRNLIGMASHRAAADRMKTRLLKRMKQAGEAEPVIASHAVTDDSLSAKQRRVTPQKIEQ